MNIKENMYDSVCGAISSEEAEVVKLFRNLDTDRKIAVIHSFYTLAAEELLFKCSSETEKK